MNNLPDHNHYCLECHNSTVHHKFPHESVGDRILAWCKTCQEDKDSVIGYCYTL